MDKETRRLIGDWNNETQRGKPEFTAKRLSVELRQDIDDLKAATGWSNRELLEQGVKKLKKISVSR